LARPRWPEAHLRDVLPKTGLVGSAHTLGKRPHQVQAPSPGSDQGVQARKHFRVEARRRGKVENASSLPQSQPIVTEHYEFHGLELSLASLGPDSEGDVG
jgi:hypothetical protein